jgi:hypothetical protein
MQRIKGIKNFFILFILCILFILVKFFVIFS